MKLKQLLFLVVLFPVVAFSQKAVYNQIKAAKENGKQFQELSIFQFLSTDLRNEKIDPEVYERLDGRRRAVKSMASVGSRLALAAVPIAAAYRTAPDRGDTG